MFGDTPLFFSRRVEWRLLAGIECLDYMLFNSLEFFLFVIVVFGAYWLIPNRVRLQNFLILVASYVFYGWWDWRFLFLIGGCSAVNFIAGLFLSCSKGRLMRRTILCLCFAVSLGVLCVFKYYNFFTESFESILRVMGFKADFATLKIVLPVGISFFTFQALSYTLDVAFGKIKATKDPVEFFAFIAFFPQLVAGPIERASNLLPQFGRRRVFSYAVAMDGLCLIVYGLFKKMVVADTLALYVDRAYSNPDFYSSVTCVIASVFFAMQIYCDFSGYSDAARGFAKLFGFELMVNFNRPYMATTFADFWRRWHISLSTWFKDYVYIPLGGSRNGRGRTVLNLWVVFLLSGLWHGASWLFVAWGGIHAVFLTCGCLKKWLMPSQADNDKGFARIISILAVGLFVTLAWIPFRAGSLKTAKSFLMTMFALKLKTSLMALCAGLGPMNFVFCLIAACFFMVSHFLPNDCRFERNRSKVFFVMTCAVIIVFFGMPAGGEFIYFQF